jgi:cellulose synthase/poly-beta-1,6-N-acetylglucosamine synthase-like glycosyltransferase
MYYGLFHLRIGRWHRKAGKEGAPEGGNESLPPVSVVLTARNDGTWLKENLVYLLEQDYPDFEVVVVDYLSHDDTQYVLKLLKDYYPHLKIVPFKEDVNLFQGKKYPLSIGIKSAKNDILLLADPDCTPKNMQWLRGMVKGYYRKDIKIVLGICGLKRTKTLLGVLQQYDEPLTIYGRPENTFVADFVGNPAINFINGHGHQGEDGSFTLSVLDHYEAVFVPSCTIVNVAVPMETVPVRRAKLGLALMASVST